MLPLPLFPNKTVMEESHTKVPFLQQGVKTAMFWLSLDMDIKSVTEDNMVIWAGAGIMGVFR